MACLAELRYAAVITDEEGAAGFGLEFLDPQNLIFFAAAFFILRKWEPSPIKVMVGVGVISALLSFI